MALLIVRPMPFLLMQQGTEWDGATFDAGQVPERTFGTGTRYPLGLTFEEMSRFYWALDVWQFKWEFDATELSGPTTGSYSIDYADAPVAGDIEDPSLPLLDRYFERSVLVVRRELATPEAGNVGALLEMSLHDVLFDPISGLHYPKIQWSSGSSGTGGLPVTNIEQTWQVEVSVGVMLTPTILITLDDQYSAPKEIQLYSSPDPIFPAWTNTTATTFLDIKPTGYLAVA